eukprot:gene18035-biopygen9919
MTQARGGYCLGPEGNTLTAHHLRTPNPGISFTFVAPNCRRNCTDGRITPTVLHSATTVECNDTPMLLTG